MRFRPCIDLHSGRVKQIVGSTLRDGVQPITNFTSDQPSSYYAKLYREDGLVGGHVIMLGPGNTAAALEALRAFPGGMHIGGGITPANASSFLDAGASHVIVTSFVFRDGIIDKSNLGLMVDAIGKKRLVLDLSCRKKEGQYFVVTDRWQRFTATAVDPDLLGSLSESCAEFLIHAVDVEGKQQGIDNDLIAFLGARSPIPVTYAGGVRDLSDIDEVCAAGNGKVDITIGSALDIFGGPLPYRSVVEWQNNHGTPS